MGTRRRSLPAGVVLSSIRKSPDSTAADAPWRVSSVQSLVTRAGIIHTADLRFNADSESPTTVTG
jgi:hypothetical protein